MSDIYNLLNNAANEKVEEKPRIPPEEYAKQKQQKRQNLYDMAEKQTHEVVSSPQNLSELFRNAIKIWLYCYQYTLGHGTMSTSNTVKR